VFKFHTQHSMTDSALTLPAAVSLQKNIRFWLTKDQRSTIDFVSAKLKQEPSSCAYKVNDTKDSVTYKSHSNYY